MTERVARVLFPFALIIAAVLWVKGYAAIGDGFSAGSVAALGAIVQYVCLGYERATEVVKARWSVLFMGVGLLLELCVLVAPMFAGIVPVSHAPAPGKAVVSVGIVELHTALLFDLGTGLLVYGGIVCIFDRLLPRLPVEEGQEDEADEEGET